MSQAAQNYSAEISSAPAVPGLAEVPAPVEVDPVRQAIEQPVGRFDPIDTQELMAIVRRHHPYHGSENYLTALLVRMSGSDVTAIDYGRYQDAEAHSVAEQSRSGAKVADKKLAAEAAETARERAAPYIEMLQWTSAYQQDFMAEFSTESNPGKTTTELREAIMTQVIEPSDEMEHVGLDLLAGSIRGTTGANREVLIGADRLFRYMLLHEAPNNPPA